MIPTAPPAGRRGKQFRAAAEGVRGGRSPRPTRRGDEGLLSLLADPYTDVDETHRRLRQLRTAFEDRGDRRAVFLSVYARMTAAVADRIRDGDFADPDWVSAYLVAFANLYRQAVYDYEVGDFEALAAPWRLAF
jgi:hypothetical protein